MTTAVPTGSPGPEIRPRPLAAVTGASSGIGEVFARRLAATHDLLLVARREDRLRVLAAELASVHGAAVEVLAADLLRDEDVDRLARRLREDPALDLLVNNAGFGVDGPFWEGGAEPLLRMHRLHIDTTLRLTHAALAALVERDRGAVINVASVAAFVHGAGSCGYSASKSWMTAFTEGLHLDLRRKGSRVQVQALCPGFTYTEFHDVMGVQRETRAPRGFWLDAGDVVEASLDGLRRRRLFVIPGWKYRLLVAVVTRLPVSLRLAFESARRR
jgi:short-subunit dehydrogenase